MLSETITASISAINLKREAQDKKKSNDDFMAALDALSTSCIQLETIIAEITELNKSGIVTDPIMSATTQTNILASIDDCGNGIQDNSLNRDTVKVFRIHSDIAKTELANAWNAGATAYSDGPRGYVAMVAGLTDNPRKAQDLDITIKAIVAKPVSVQNINDLVSKVTEAKTITASFSLEPEFETFLKKVSSQQATVADLTPGVQNWLKEKKLMGKLKIYF